MKNTMKLISISVLFVASNVMAAPKAEAKKAYERDYPVVFGTFEFTGLDKDNKKKYYKEVADFFKRNPTFAINERMKTADGIETMMSISEDWSKAYDHISQKCTETANYKRCTELSDYRDKILVRESTRPLMTESSEAKIDVLDKTPGKSQRKSSQTTQNDSDSKEDVDSEKE